MGKTEQREDGVWIDELGNPILPDPDTVRQSQEDIRLGEFQTLDQIIAELRDIDTTPE